ncbi:hypothetical protein ACROYT_G004541, partial [Oculina patagonica]
FDLVRSPNDTKPSGLRSMTCDENTEVVVAPTPQENVILRENPTAISNLHCTKHDSSDPATKNYFSCDYETHLNIDNNFKIPVVCDFDLRKKIILLIHVIFLLSMLHTSQITDYLWNVLQVLLSTSLLHALQIYEKLVLIIFLI